MNKLQVLQKILEQVFLATGMGEGAYLRNKASAFVMREGKVHLVTHGERCLEDGTLVIEATREAVEADVTPESFNQYGEDCKSILLNIWLQNTKNELFQNFIEPAPMQPEEMISLGQIETKANDDSETDA